MLELWEPNRDGFRCNYFFGDNYQTIEIVCKCESEKRSTVYAQFLPCLLFPEIRESEKLGSLIIKHSCIIRNVDEQSVNRYATVLTGKQTARRTTQRKFLPRYFTLVPHRCTGRQTIIFLFYIYFRSWLCRRAVQHLAAGGGGALPDGKCITCEEERLCVRTADSAFPTLDVSPFGVDILHKEPTGWHRSMAMGKDNQVIRF